MSLLKLISNLDSTTKTKLLGSETTKILRFTFCKKDTDAIPTQILDQAIATKDGTNLIYNKRLRTRLIESIRISRIIQLGFHNHQEAIDAFNANIELFFDKLLIEAKYKKTPIIDTRKSIELINPVHGALSRNLAFPHDYQRRLKDKILYHLKTDYNNSILAAMPTGAGKTVLAMEILVDLFRDKLKQEKKQFKVGWFVDSKELCEQSFLSFQKTWGQKGDRPVLAERYFDMFDELTQIAHDKITFAAFTLLAERLKTIEVQEFLMDLDLIIIDEAHGSNANTYHDVLYTFSQLSRNGKMLGLTATPYRTDDNEYQSLKNMFHSYFEITDQEEQPLKSPMKYLVERGFLAKVNYEVLNSSRKGNSNTNYYSELHSSIMRECEKVLKRKENTIIFAESKSHAIALNLFLKQNGLDNELIVGETNPTKRKEFLERFGDKDDQLSIIVNHQILSTGIDVPGMNSIMILSKINSPTLALQIIGRAMRGKLNGGNETNTIYLTKDNYNQLQDFQLLESIVLKH